MDDVGEPTDSSNGTDAAAAVAPFLGPAPLIAGESAASYDELLARITATLRPSDVLEEIWVRDAVDLVWEALRLRRLKSHLMTASAHEGMYKVLDALDVHSCYQTARGWAAREPQAVEAAEAALRSAGLGIDTVMACTLSKRIEDIDRIDRMTMAAEARRSAVLHEIERHRATFARRAQGAISRIEAAEIKAIAPHHAPALEPA